VRYRTAEIFADIDNIGEKKACLKFVIGYLRNTLKGKLRPEVPFTTAEVKELVSTAVQAYRRETSARTG
jgi:hypothetical protein